MNQGLKGIKCIKNNHGATSVSRSKSYQEVSNVYINCIEVSDLSRNV